MPVLIASDVVQISMLGRWSNGHPVVNVLHYRVDAAVGSVSIDQAVEDVMENWQSQLIPEFRDNYTFEGAAFIDLRTEDGATGIIPPNTNEVTQGGSTGNSSNPGDALLVHKRTSSSRGVRQGRMYLPPPGSSNQNEDGRIDVAAQQAMNTRLASFLANTTQNSTGFPVTIEDANRYLVVLHKDGTSDRVTGLQCDGLIASQRRRVR